MREEDDRQGSLFGGDAFGPPPPRLRAPGPPVPRASRPAQPAHNPPESLSQPPLAPPEPPSEPGLRQPESLSEPAIAPPESLREPASSGSAVVFAPPEEADAEIRVSRARRPALDGPTLDDTVSHAWEALVARVPAACPVCHNEIDPAPTGALQGRCRTCNVTLD